MRRPPLAVRLRQLRLERGLSMEEAAKKARISFSYWAKIEQGVRAPGSAALRRIARAVGADPDDLLGL